MARVVLVRPKMSANIGSSARVMKNFGVSALYLVNPLRPLNADAYALAAHAPELIENARHCSSIAEALQGVAVALATTARQRRDDKPVYSVREAAARYASHEVALLFGAEDAGLSNEELETCQAIITIPTAAYASLNLAQAVNVVCYEFFQAQQQPSPSLPTRTLAPRDHMERFYEELRQLLLAIDYTDEARAPSVLRMMRRIVDRAQLSPRELAALRGLLRQLGWARRNR